MTEIAELKPCPFCGGDGLVHRNREADNMWRVTCKNCDAGPSSRLNRETAIAAWNRRAALATPDDGWRKVPKEATQELLADASSEQAGDKQVLCYQNGEYYNAWLVFEPYEGGWIWMNEADSEPNPSHYRPLPAPPANGRGE